MLNNNFSKLVKLQKKYRAKQRNRQIFIILAVLAFIAVIYLFFSSNLFDDTTQMNTSVQTQDNIIKTENNITDTPLTKTREIPTVQPTPKKELIQVSKPQPQKDPFQLQVTERKSLYNLLVEHKKEQSYKTAIKVAQFYFNEQDYEKAVKWAVEASKKDPAQAQSWIIYAKAKKALGKPDIAKKALTIFLKHNYSQSAQNLLDSL